MKILSNPPEHFESIELIEAIYRRFLHYAILVGMKKAESKFEHGDLSRKSQNFDGKFY